MSEEETVSAPAPASTPAPAGTDVGSGGAAAGIANAGAEGGDGTEDVKKHGSKMLVGPRPPQNAIFIHKLYQILEDESLHDLIWWTPSGLSFMIKPVERFSKALATYFKHTNITSFVRQLNIYGFHKVSHDHSSNDANSGDDANTNDDSNAHDDNSGNKNSSGDENTGGGVQEKEKSNPTKIWEFKHSSGIFKKGDIEGLKHIKRRASSRNNSSINSRKNSSNQNYDIDSGARVRPSSIQDPSTSSNSFGNFVPQIPGANNSIPEYFNNSHVTYENANHAPLESNNPEMQEQNRPPNFQDETLKHLKEINFDMVKIIESMQHFISLQHSFCSQSFTFKNVSKKKSENIVKDHQKQLQAFESDMLTFKQHVMSRAHRTIDSLCAVNAAATAASVAPAPAPTSTSAYAPKSQYEMMVPPGNQYVPQKSSSTTNIPSRFNTASVPPSQLFVQYQPQSQQHVTYAKQPAHVPNFINQPIPIQQLPPQYADTFSTPQMMHNPFASKNNNKPGNTKRTNSVLMDPLTPAASVGVQGPLNYPIMNINPSVRDYNKPVPQNMAPSPIYPINEPTTRLYSQPKMRSLGSTSSLPNDRRNSPLKLTPRSSLNEDSLYPKPRNFLKSSISGTSLSSSFTLVANNPAPIRYSQQGLLRSLNKAANCAPDSVTPLDSSVLTGPPPKNMDNLPAVSSNLINSPMNVEHSSSLSQAEPAPQIELPQPSLPTTSATKNTGEADNSKRKGSGVYSLLNQEDSSTSSADPKTEDKAAPALKKVKM
ncbi:CPS_HP_G0077160.mRNA.1.CDS.1 [Saccharomyces cerevisiae]|nr:CPS_HP_G0073010.mRNA.1.CDS.1 [Saccharomyces cerevisiae]CAI5001846.1 CPS_HP_G0077160.mRNA.1.CDS.1 [Saccharomyces cerevisiae]CAI6889595.1 CPS_HP_G0073010.mRNA.1.CDS.1 [Saccharomyces cerevisiae]CAI6910243.1 CPS_HP_G0077160.mRNA.1.CDS.1 [Saccharomyces cerevisiae]CAI7471693.1 CPS_collapsed_G0052720.mRNA.1.CDS.1 [Saccharomyces cerevisiae]